MANVIHEICMGTYKSETTMAEEYSIVKRLRELPERMSIAGGYAQDCHDAADTIETLAAALEPMAKAAENFDGFAINNAEEWFAYSGQSSLKENGKGAITVGDLRRARTALAKLKGETL